ncbi:MAG: hypothetical protein LUI02_01255 [Clostridiales bacterium]|nr:hypothetical protein [Clostridiales bacterium]
MKIKAFAFGLCLMALLALPAGIMRAQAATEPEEDVTAGIMGRSVVDEMEDSEDVGLLESLATIANRYSFLLVGAEATQDEYKANAWTTASAFTGKTYYHRSAYKGRKIFNGMDVSWWQGGGNGSTITKIDWTQAHNEGISYVFVRASSRDSSSGSLYADTCADAHIQGALANNINVGLYVFSQALTTSEAKEEANALISQIKQYGWDITMPLVMDRENGSYKRLVAGQLSKSQETAIIEAFAQTVLDAGYTPMVYANASWLVDYVDTDALDKMGCKIWMARYNTYADTRVNSDATYEKLSAINYEFWQYSSTGTISGFSGNVDVDFWYKDLSVAVTGLAAEEVETDSISLRWDAVDSASSYQVYRSQSGSASYSLIDTVAGTCSYTDTGLSRGTTYSYKIKPIYQIGGTTYSGTDSASLSVTTESEVTLPEQVTGVYAATLTKSKIALSWAEVEGASGYCIYRRNLDTGKYVKIATVRDGGILSYEDAGLKAATEYTYKVSAYITYEGKNYVGTRSVKFKGMTKPAKVKNVKLSTAGSSITVSWDKVARATSYRVYRLNETTGKYKLIAKTKKGICKYTDKSAKSGESYTYKVRAYFSAGSGETYNKSEAVTMTVK